jgi:hypothetical protein
MNKTNFDLDFSKKNLENQDNNLIKRHCNSTYLKKQNLALKDCNKICDNIDLRIYNNDFFQNEDFSNTAINNVLKSKIQEWSDTNTTIDYSYCEINLDEEKDEIKKLLEKGYIFNFNLTEGEPCQKKFPITIKDRINEPSLQFNPINCSCCYTIFELQYMMDVIAKGVEDNYHLSIYKIVRYFSEHGWLYLDFHEKGFIESKDSGYVDILGCYYNNYRQGGSPRIYLYPNLIYDQATKIAKKEDDIRTIYVQLSTKILIHELSHAWLDPRIMSGNDEGYANGTDQQIYFDKQVSYYNDIKVCKTMEESMAESFALYHINKTGDSQLIRIAMSLKNYDKVNLKEYYLGYIFSKNKIHEWWIWKNHKRNEDISTKLNNYNKFI